MHPIIQMLAMAAVVKQVEAADRVAQIAHHVCSFPKAVRPAAVAALFAEIGSMGLSVEDMLARCEKIAERETVLFVEDGKVWRGEILHTTNEWPFVEVQMPESMREDLLKTVRRLQAKVDKAARGPVDELLGKFAKTE